MVHLNSKASFYDGRSSIRSGFTIVELLVVIGIIAVLISILISGITKARKSAETVYCLNNQRVLIQASLMFAKDNRGMMPYTTWGHAEKVDSWCFYFQPAAISGNSQGFVGKQDEVKTGQLWNYLQKYESYRCASDKGPWTAGSIMNLSSYCMNGAISGFSTNGGTNRSFNIDQFKGKSGVFFETPMTKASGNPANDATNYPPEGVSARHKHGTTVSYIDGSANVLSSDEYIEACQAGPSVLWCDPSAKDGGRSKYTRSVTNIPIQE